MRKYKTALLIGRFQPFHKGHLYLIKVTLGIAEKIIIAIGSAASHNQDNPFSLRERLKIIHLVIDNEEWKDRIEKIIEINDDSSDDTWLDESLRKAGEFDLVVGNNEWVNGIFEKAGYTIKRFPYYKRYLYEGTKIRKLINEGKIWENRVPKYLISLLKKHE